MRLAFFARFLAACCLLAAAAPRCVAGRADMQLNQGWALLIRDQDSAALDLFSRGYATALQEQDSAAGAKALLYLGIATYGSSLSSGLDYATRAMSAYHALERSQAAVATEGRSRCLQLISTIYQRQGKIRTSISLSQQALTGLPPQKDSTGTLGLAYLSLGNSYKRLGQYDSASYYHQKALAELRLSHYTAYLPGACVAAGASLLRLGKKEEALLYYREALHIADSSANLQAKTSALLALSAAQMALGDTAAAERQLSAAAQIAAGLSDRSFYLNSLELLAALKKQQQDTRTALHLYEQMAKIRDSLHDWEKDRMVNILETQFNLSEKERSLELIRQEHRLARLTNSLLWAGILILLGVGTSIIALLRRINRRNRELIHTREELSAAEKIQQQLREQQIGHELEFKESQLSALTLQMLQKNELLLELKEKLAGIRASEQDLGIAKLLNQGLNQDKDWADFNAYFESINKNFYTKLRLQFPGISPNDLRICALIRLNLSSKDMANILNISPDSVKTARYRLRKKLQLSTEDNLTEFIMNL